MKTFRTILMVALLPLFITSCDYDKVITDNKYPEKITEYVKTHFPENPVIQIIKEHDGLELTYDVSLKDGYFLTFNRKEQVTDIESINKLPDSVIPAKILAYVNTNFADNYIIGWELDGPNQQIELNNHLELEFTMKGDFLRYDN